MLNTEQRQAWISILAKASPQHLEALVDSLGALPVYGFLRSPEMGLTMVQGRVGGTGQAFCLGEMTLTRCVVGLHTHTEGDEIAGFGYVAGRSSRHAELAAVCDALLQHPDWQEKVQSGVIYPLLLAAQQQQAQQDRQTEATRVNFFTLVRGES
jgi:alpha-D-ribose 1-methylphosphonate 5-triphosphate synthase subunit PhnG